MLSRTQIRLAAAAFVAACCASCNSADAPSAPEIQSGVAEGQAIRAYVDPVTGQLREPTPAELAEQATTASVEGAAKRRAAGASALNADQSASSPDITVRLADGTLMRAADPELQHEVTACILPGGVLKLDCTAAELKESERAAAERADKR